MGAPSFIYKFLLLICYESGKFKRAGKTVRYLTSQIGINKESLNNSERLYSDQCRT
jgi:hypothetical protein